MLIYVLLIPLHTLQFDGRARLVMVLADSLAALFFLAQRLLLAKRDLSPAAMRLLAVADVLLPYGTVLLLFYFEPDPFYTLFVVLILVACGAFLLSPWWLAASMALLVTSWVAILAAADKLDNPFQLTAVLLATVALAVAAFVYRLRNQREIRTGLRRASRELNQRRTTEQSLRESENRLELAITSSGGGWWDVAIDPSRPTVLPDEAYLSPTLKALIGFDEEELPNSLKAWRDRILPQDRDRVWQSAEQHLHGHRSVHSAEYRIRHKSGQVLWMETLGRVSYDEAGRPIRFSGVDRDITGRITRERAIDVLSRAVEQSSSVVVITDPEGAIEYVNPKFTQVTGYAAQEVLGKNPRLLRGGDTPREVYADLWATITAGEEWHGELKNKTKSGEPYWALASISRVVDDQGQVINYVGVQEDITARKLAEEHLRKSQRLEVVGQLVSGVAHDFNNLLTSILGYSEMALTELTEATTCRSYLEEVAQAGESAASLTRQLLAVARQQILRPRLLELNAELSKCEELLQRTLGEDVQVVMSLDPEVGQVEFDPTQLQQVLLNLAVNGRDAMPQGGLLTFETANVELDQTYVADHPGARAGSFVMLAISDTGSGMDKATLDQIFEPFFTTKKLGQGTGIGLSTTYGIVKQSGGYIWAYSELGRGTTFKIYLPRHSGAADEVPPEVEIFDTAGTETVLVVEDADRVRNLLVEFLVEDGYTVLEARDVQDAARVVAEHEGPDLLITDLVLPSGSGLQLAEELGQRFESLKVLLITGYAQAALRQRHAVDPDLPLLTKPFTMQDFAIKVRKVLDGETPSKKGEQPAP